MIPYDFDGRFVPLEHEHANIVPFCRQTTVLVRLGGVFVVVDVVQRKRVLTPNQLGIVQIARVRHRQGELSLESSHRRYEYELLCTKELQVDRQMPFIAQRKSVLF